MKIKLNQIDFDVTPVPGPLRAAVMTDPSVAGAASRHVWRWDAAAAKAELLSPVTPQKTLALPNALVFYVPKPGSNGVLTRAEGPSRKMTERFLEAVGARSLRDVMIGLARVVGQSHQAAPLKSFADLNPLASYSLRIDIDFAVVQLANPARNLSGVLALPAQIVFRAEDIVPLSPDAALPDMANTQPGYVLAPPTEAALAIRRMALAQRMADLSATLNGQPLADLDATDPRKPLAARLGLEWKAISPRKAA